MSGLVKQASGLVFGKKSDITGPAANYQPVNFSSPGFTGTMNNGVYTIGSTPVLNNAITSLQNAYGGLSTDLRSLLPSVQAGYGKLTDAAKGVYGLARTNLEQKRRQAIGDLQSNLAQRRLLGSSFADSALSNANATYDQTANDLATQEAQTQAQNYLQELNAQHQILNEANTANISSAADLLKQLNIGGQIGAQLATGLNSITGNLAGLQSHLLSDYSGRQGGLVGSAIGAATSAFGGGAPTPKTTMV